MNLRLAATFALLSTSPVAGLELDAMTDAERTSFRAEVRAYLLEHPDVLMEAIGVLEAREQQEKANNDVTLARTNADALFQDGYSFVGGNPDGDITVVEFMDYRCGYCKKAFPEVEALVSGDGNIRYIVKEFPILGEQSTRASQFAIATKITAGDDAYKAVHNTLMELRGDITKESLRRLASTLDLDTDAIFAAMESDEVNQIIAENRALAQRMQITGTPTFVVEDQMLRGYVPQAQMEQLVGHLRAN